MSLNYTEINTDLYNKFVEINYEFYPTQEPTEIISTYKPTSQNSVLNYSCICNVERKSNENILIVTTSITSSLSFVMFLLLIWYKYFYKKRVFNYIYNNESHDNFGIEYNQS
jgi:hypothetical protein